MALGAKLQLRQSQSLTMTPQLMQSIRLLQMTHLELERFVEDEIERNPLLEWAEPHDTAGELAEPPEVALPQQDQGDEHTLLSAEAISQQMDTSLENVFPDDPGVADRLGPDLAAQWKSAGGGAEASASDFDFEDVLPAVVTLRDHVEEQIAFAFLDPSARLVARDLADALDEAGYMRGDVEEIAVRLGLEPHAVLEVLKACQGFEPAGIFARDLAECLGLQLARRDRFDPAMQALVGNLELLARRDFQSLKKLCGVDEEDLVEMMAEIRHLDPRPGMAYSGGRVETIVPDVEVRAASDGSWSVELNPDALPRVLVDNVYYARVAKSARSQGEKDFLTECHQNASWLTRSLDQRARTILKVASEIVRQQDAFLVHGIRHLRPLNLRTVAEAIGMHESTVSRVTANKYMLTPRGAFELRYFFTAAIASVGEGDAHSAEAVRDRIRQLVSDEAPAAVLSDDQIVEILQRGGIDIARRTVAKYRESMNIPSSVQRRREKRALAAAGR
ncbi:RNA polymerase factor sigma-54 [Mesorhizobium sp. KR2-14]|uniref:RNA polymerase factor sigma-54 n=1 Tax=Mesorhizobium sp. KR2-14 TaxID=3156610 RepID=UPI0032B36C55